MLDCPHCPHPDHPGHRCGWILSQAVHEDVVLATGICRCAGITHPEALVRLKEQEVALREMIKKAWAMGITDQELAQVAGFSIEGLHAFAEYEGSEPL